MCAQPNAAGVPDAGDTRPPPSADDKEARKAFHLAEIARFPERSPAPA